MPKVTLAPSSFSVLARIEVGPRLVLTKYTIDGVTVLAYSEAQARQLVNS